MEPRVQPGALGRPAVEVFTAQAFAIAMFRHEPGDTDAKPWLLGMAAAGLWILGQVDQAPVSKRMSPATAAALGEEMLAAGKADMPGQGNPRDPAKMYARGVYQMIVYAMGHSDEMPVKLTREVAEAILAHQQAACPQTATMPRARTVRGIVALGYFLRRLAAKIS